MIPSEHRNAACYFLTSILVLANWKRQSEVQKAHWEVVLKTTLRICYRVRSSQSRKFAECESRTLKGLA